MNVIYNVIKSAFLPTVLRLYTNKTSLLCYITGRFRPQSSSGFHVNITPSVLHSVSALSSVG